MKVILVSIGILYLCFLYILMHYFYIILSHFFFFAGFLKSERPSRQLLVEFAEQKNAVPLPAIRQNYGLRLPNDRFCLIQPNVGWKVAGFHSFNTTKFQISRYCIKTDFRFAEIFCSFDFYFNIQLIYFRVMSSYVKSTNR